MKLLTSILFLIFGFMPCFGQRCDETSSYNKTWTLQDRYLEKQRVERLKSKNRATPEQLMRLGSGYSYPTTQMECGKGFSEGLAEITLNGKSGFINSKGQLVIKAKYNDAGRFSEHLAPVEFENGKWGYISRKGKLVIKPVFDWALGFKEGLALIQVGEKWGYIDKRGQIVIKPQFVEANSFSEGLANVQIYQDKYKTGYIDKRGNWVIQPIFDGSSSDFYKGKTKIYKDVLSENGKFLYHGCFFIDITGKILSETEDFTEYPYLYEEMNEGLAPSNYGDIWGYVDEDDKIVIERKFDWAWAFQNGFALVAIKDKTGYIDKKGRYIWKPTK